MPNGWNTYKLSTLWSTRSLVFWIKGGCLIKEVSPTSFLDSKVLRFGLIKGLYPNDEEFKEIFKTFAGHPHGHIENGFLFRGARLIIISGSLRKLLIIEVHGGALARPFGIEYTYIMLKERYYWPKMANDFEDFVKTCATYQLTKSQVSPQGLYSPLPIPYAP